MLSTGCGRVNLARDKHVGSDGAGKAVGVMTEGTRCPICQAGSIHRGEGRLDQSGGTYLPTTVWTCDVCGYARYESALGAAWRAVAVAPVEEAPPSPFAWPARRAA
jgi:hypothetical protein